MSLSELDQRDVFSGVNIEMNRMFKFLHGRYSSPKFNEFDLLVQQIERRVKDRLKEIESGFAKGDSGQAGSR